MGIVTTTKETAMRVTAPRTQFAKLLASITKVVESRNTIPILGHVRLIGADGKLTATGTDLDIEMSGAIDATISDPGLFCVDAKLLAGIVGKAAGEDITLDHDGKQVTVKSGRSRFNLPTLPVEDFPTIEAGTFAAEFEADLAALFAPVQFAISTEETRYYLNGIYLHVDVFEDGAGKLTAVATDGHRLARNIGQPCADFAGVIVPRKTVSILPKGTIKVRLSEAKIQFETADVLITSKLVDGTFPDYKRILPTANDKVVTFDVPAMKQATERVSVISSERGRAVKLAFADNAATLSVNNPDQGSATEEVPVSYDGDNIEIGFNSAYLTELIGIFHAGDVKMAMADAGSPTLFTSDRAEGLLAVLMPMRV